MNPTPKSKSRAPGLRGVGLGIELAASLIGFTLLGLWIDHKFSTGPWGTLICVVVGFIGGLYNFIRSSLRAMKAPTFSQGASQEGIERDEPGR